MSKTEKIEYLREHLAYEREMLGFTFNKIFQEQSQLNWNSYFESFGIHSRNLFDFLRSDGNSTDFCANDFVKNYKHDPINVPKIDPFNESFFHMTKARARKAKVNIGDAQAIARWIDHEWARWVGSLPGEYRSMVDPKPVCVPTIRLYGPTPETATNHVWSITGPSTTQTR